MDIRVITKDETYRLGKFYVTISAIKEPAIVEVLKQLEFIPYRVEFLASLDEFEYVGTSIKFVEIEKGSTLPEYRIIIREYASRSNDKLIIEVSAIRL